MKVDKAKESKIEKILNKRNCEVLSVIEEVYSRTWFLGNRGKSKKYKEDGSRIQRETECRSKMTREVG